MLDHTITGNGEPLVFLHGALVTRSMWNPQVSYFNKNYRIVTIDMPAHGSSPDVEGDYTIEKIGNAVIDLLDRLKIPSAHLCGHSLGGMAAQYIAAVLPSRVRKLILAETAFGTHNNFWERILSAVSRPMLKAMSRDSLVKLSAKTYGGLHENVARYITEEMSKYDKDTCVRVMSAAFGYAGKSLLAQIAAPTLVLVSEKNGQTRSQAKRMARLIPSAVMQVIPNSHHILNMDNPDEFNRVVSGFLKG